MITVAIVDPKDDAVSQETSQHDEPGVESAIGWRARMFRLDANFTLISVVCCRFHIATDLFHGFHHILEKLLRNI